MVITGYSPPLPPKQCKFSSFLNCFKKFRIQFFLLKNFCKVYSKFSFFAKLALKMANHAQWHDYFFKKFCFCILTENRIIKQTPYIYYI